MKIDDILTHIGEFGYYQRRTYVLLVLTWIFSFPYMISSVFYMKIQDHRCRIPGLTNDTYKTQSDHHKTLIHSYIPGSTDSTKTYDECHLYSFNASNVVFNNNRVPINASKQRCSEWVYSTELLTTTVVSQMNLVCEDTYKISAGEIIYFFGVLVGSLLLGVLSDIIGRRRTLLLSTFSLFCTSFVLSWAPNYAAYVIIRFAIGFFNAGMFMTAYVIGMEWVGPSKRTAAGLIISLMSSFGQLYMTLVAYLIRKWNYTEIAMSIPVGIMFFMFWNVPESPRWLLNKGRHVEMKELFQHAAKMNGTSLPENLVIDAGTSDNKETGKLWLLFTSWILSIRTIIIFLNWIMVVMAYYSLALNTENLFGDFFLNFTISVLVEFPGVLLPIFLLDRFGRMKVHCLFMLVGGVACLSTIFTVTFLEESEQWLTTMLAMIGKLFTSGAFATVFVLSAELFPTVVRNVAMGACSCLARIGTMISPYISGTTEQVGGNIGHVLPLVIIGSSLLLAGILALCLPETLNRDLPETIEDGKNFGNSKKYRRVDQEYSSIDPDADS